MERHEFFFCHNLKESKTKRNFLSYFTEGSPQFFTLLSACFHESGCTQSFRMIRKFKYQRPAHLTERKQRLCNRVTVFIKESLLKT